MVVASSSLELHVSRQSRGLPSERDQCSVVRLQILKSNAGSEKQICLPVTLVIFGAKTIAMLGAFILL